MNKQEIEIDMAMQKFEEVVKNIINHVSSAKEGTFMQEMMELSLEYIRTGFDDFSTENKRILWRFHRMFVAEDASKSK